MRGTKAKTAWATLVVALLALPIMPVDVASAEPPETVEETNPEDPYPGASDVCPFQSTQSSQASNQSSGSPPSNASFRWVPAPSDNYTQDGYIIGFDCFPRQVRSGEFFAGERVNESWDWVPFVVVHPRDINAMLERLARNPHVVYVEPNVVGIRSRVTNDPNYLSSVGPQMIRATDAWDTDFGYTGSGYKKVCFVDSGVRRTHEDLAGNYVGGTDLIGNDADPMETSGDGHGTQMAGIASAVPNNAKGIAGVGNVKFLMVRAETTVAQVTSAITWCKNNGGDVINLSLQLGSTYVQSMQDAIISAWSAGKLIVAAAGNKHIGNQCPTGDCVEYPAKYNYVIGVSCYTFSRVICSNSLRGTGVDLAAPGDGLYTTYLSSDSSYVATSATSPAAAYVSGVAAFAWSKYQSKTPLEMLNALVGYKQCCDGSIQERGYGFVDLKAVLDGLAGSTSWNRNQPSSCDTFSDAAQYRCNTWSFSWYNPSSPTTVTLGDDVISGKIFFPSNFGVSPVFGRMYWYGTPHDGFYIGSNGVICFTLSGCNSNSPSTIPDTSNPADQVACAWADLNLNAGGRVRYWEQVIDAQRGIVVEFFSVPFYSGSKSASSFQIHLLSDGQVRCVYNILGTDGGVTVIGIQGVMGNIGLRYTAISGLHTYSYSVRFESLYSDKF